MWKGLFLPCVAQSLFNDTVHCKLRAFSLFFLVRRAKRTKYLNDHAREWRPPLFLAASTLARACTPLTKSEEKECSQSEGDVTQDDSQRRFLAHHSVAALLRLCFEWLQHCSNIATLCCVKNRRCQSCPVTSP